MADENPQQQNEASQSEETFEVHRGKEEYNPEDLERLSDHEHVRARPSMYIGDTGVRGVHHLVYEVVDNSIDEAMADFASEVSVQVNLDGSVTVEDNGRGIPVGRHAQLSEEMGREVSTLEGVMTVLKFGGKFQKGAYQTSGGLHGVGVTVVNFLSEWCEVEVYREGHVYQQEYERGIPAGEVQRVGATKKRGTKTTFKPDSQIFETTNFNYDTLQKRLQELAFLNRGVKIVFKDERSDQGDEFCYERGLIDFVEHLNRASDALHNDVVHIQGEAEHVTGEGDEQETQIVGYEIALQYTGEYTENVHSYVNNIHTHEGGTHVSGFRTALTRTLNNYGKKANLFKDMTPSGDDFREGLTAVISMRVPHPKFEGQTKTKLGNSEVEGIVNSALGEALGKYLEENPRTAKTIVNKGLLAAQAREAARKAKQLMRDRKGIMSGGSLPGKLRDCTSKEVDRCELYLVEGDSAGGSAEGGRLREYQAILPLRGKIINAYKSREDKVLANNEIQAMIHAIGIGFGMDQDLAKRRYSKIIIMTDADVDGSHIRTLLLCFFYRQMNRLIEGGHVFVAQPPLFRVKSGRSKNADVYYVQSEDEMRSQLMEKGLEGCRLDAGGGKLIEGEQFNRLCRTLAGVEEALVALERRGISLKLHAERQDAESGRLPIYHVFVGRDEHWFTTRAQKDEFLRAREAESGEMDVADTLPAEGNGQGGGAEDPTTRLHITELHEVKTINTALKDLAELGFDIQSLIPQERTGMQDARYKLLKGDDEESLAETGLEDLRELLGAVRAAGERGLTITRFKGLGEMNAEELRDTTLMPENRTLMQVSMADAGAADEMFRVLMGDKVEPRREFIEKHALEVRNLDV